MRSPYAFLATFMLSLGVLAGCTSAGPGPLKAQSQPSDTFVLEGEVAYTDVLLYDYTGDGKRNRIRFWMAFDAHSAKGAPGTADFRPASGSMRYFLRDEDSGTKVMKWRRGLDMEGAPKDAPVPMTDIKFVGETVTFQAFGMRWTITDGGSNYRRDRILVEDGFRSAVATRLYAGDVTVGPAK